MKANQQQQQQQKFVIVRAMNNRQYTVPLVPNITFYDILKHVCQKTNLEPAEHILVFRNRPQDSSLMFRFSGIPNKAMLAMERAKRARVLSQVTIVLHCENGARPSGTFHPTASLLEVLQQLCPELARADANPVMIYTRCELLWDQLAETTLENLGQTGGGAVIRLLQRKPEELKLQANVSSPLPKVMRAEEPAAPITKKVQATETVSKLPETPPACAEPLPQAQQVPLLATEQPAEVPPPVESVSECATPINQNITSGVPAKDEGLSVPKISSERPGKIVYIGDRQAVLYHRELYEQEPPYNDEDDSFFELTVAEVIQLQKQLQERVRELESMPLVASTWRELQRQKTMLNLISHYPKSVIRILFPDRYILQGVFQVHETVADVENFVREFLIDPATPFTLYTTPPKEILPSTATLLELNCVPRAMLHFGPSVSPASGCCYLQSKLMDQLSDVYGAAEVAAQAMRRASNKSGGDGASVPSSVATSATTEQQQHREDNQAAGAASLPERNTNSAKTQTQLQHSKQEAMLLKFLKK